MVRSALLLLVSWSLTACAEPDERRPRRPGDAAATPIPGEPPPGGDSFLPAGDATISGVFDLTIDGIEQAPTLVPRHFEADSCWLAAGCAGAAGLRTMLALRVRVKNLGPDALPLTSLLETSPCFVDGELIPGLLAWRLLDGAGNSAAQGSMATACVADQSGAGGGVFVCSSPGLSGGWSDVQPRGSTCHLGDVTGVAAGAYQLEVVVNPNGLIPETTLANNTLTAAVQIPAELCDTLACGGTCCPGECRDGVCMLPDLNVERQPLEQSAWIQEVWFPPWDCALYEGCVEAPGRRRLLRFTTQTSNWGNADLLLGDPTLNPEMEYSACHGHFHYTGYADYRLLDGGGAVAALGHKQSFCLIDSEPVAPNAPPGPNYDCDYQGITVGWSDVYPDYLDCQWVDVTGVAPGDYTLRAQVNPDGSILELDYTDNTSTVPINVPLDPRACQPSIETCDNGKDDDCDGAIDEDCAALAAPSCALARPIDAGLYRLALATGAGPGSSCGGTGGAAYLSLSLAAPERVYQSTHGSAGDTVIAVRAGCAGVEIGCNDDSCGRLQSAWGGELPAGEHVITVRAKSAATASALLAVQRAGCNGLTAIGHGGTFAGNTTGGPTDAVSSCTRWGGRGPERAFWFTTCPGPNPVTISTCGLASFDTEIELRQGGCSGVVHRGACNDDAWGLCPTDPRGSHIATTLLGPNGGDGLWVLIVDGQGPAESGPFAVRVLLP